MIIKSANNFESNSVKNVVDLRVTVEHIRDPSGHKIPFHVNLDGAGLYGCSRK